MEYKATFGMFKTMRYTYKAYSYLKKYVNNMYSDFIKLNSLP